MTSPRTEEGPQVTDAQVFEAMGWEWVVHKKTVQNSRIPAGHRFLVERYDDSVSWFCWPARGDEPIADIQEGVPPVMSNPSSPEAWVAVPILMRFIAEQGWALEINASPVNAHGRNHTQIAIRKALTEEARIAMFGDNELPYALGAAIVRAEASA